MSNGAVFRGEQDMFACQCKPCGLNITGFVNATEAAECYDIHSGTESHYWAVVEATKAASVAYKKRQEDRLLRNIL
jgi:hypothetical protein